MSTVEIFQGLDEASKKHERDIVVEFAPDRFLHTLGVHFMILLAIVAKVTEVTSGQKSSCYSASGEMKYDRGFVTYASVYCWKSHDISSLYSTSSNYSSCTMLQRFQRFDGVHLIDDSVFVKSFVQWLPYGMLIEAFLLSLPSVWWHFRVGARLMGHLKFVKLLLKDIYEAINNIPAGIYQRHTREDQDVPTDICCRRRNDATRAEDGRPVNCFEYRTCKCGHLTDRDMFSLLCYENFSSLIHHPYVEAIFALTCTKKFQTHASIRSMPLKSAILEHWCHKDNFRRKVIVTYYEIKHMLGIVTSAISLLGLLSITSVIGKNGWTTSIFLCDILYHENACMLCTVPRMAESVGFLFVMLLMTAMYLLLSVWCLLTFNKKDPKLPDFLSSSYNKNSVAFLAAYKKATE